MLKQRAKDRAGIEIIVPLVAWCALVNLIGVYAYWPYDARKCFYLMLASVGLILAVPLLRRLLRGRALALRLRSLTVPILIGCTVAFGWFQLHSFYDQLQAPRNKTRLVDIAQNTYESGRMFFDKGVNPYAFRGQIWHDVHGKPHITREGGKTYMYGIQYKYGYPYFPWMFFSYEGFRHLSDNYNSMRIGNLVFLLLNLLGMVLLAKRVVPPEDRLTAALASAATLLCAKNGGIELFSLGSTDITIPCYLIFGVLALHHKKDVTGGALFALAQASKVLPGALITLVTFCWFRDRRRRLRFTAAYLGVVALVVGPFFVWDQEAFFSATILYYLTFHKFGDGTAYYSVVSKPNRALFRFTRWPLIALFVFFCLRKRDQDISQLLVANAVSYLIFLAFNTMFHLNYLWSIYTLCCSALVLQMLRQQPDPDPSSRQLSLPGIS